MLPDFIGCICTCTYVAPDNYISNSKFIIDFYLYFQICLICFQKSDGSIITPDLVPLITEYIYDSYQIDQLYLPAGMCKKCKTRIRSFKSSTPRLPFSEKVNCGRLALHVKATVAPYRLRNPSGQCNCEICCQGFIY